MSYQASKDVRAVSRSVLVSFTTSILMLGLTFGCGRPSETDLESIVQSQETLQTQALAPQASPVNVELLADVSIVQSGNDFKLGVLLDIEPGWYIYWKHPGASGEPTQVDFALPQDFVSSPIRWPSPIRVTSPDAIEGYGYRDQVLLQTDVQASNHDPDHEWHLTATVNWLACKEECLPGQAFIELLLPVSISGTRLINHGNVARFENWSTRVPIRLDAPNRPFSAELRTGVHTPTAMVKPEMILRWTVLPSNIEWFPSQVTATVFPTSEWRTTRQRTEVVFNRPTNDNRSSSEFSFGVQAITGVVTYTSPNGERLAAELSVDLEQ
jgi:DsbC/DsbD-like thiol-disulfide interchange protein